MFNIAKTNTQHFKHKLTYKYGYRQKGRSCQIQFVSLFVEE